MAIHPSTKKRADALGVIIRDLPISEKTGALEGAPTGTVECHWPKHNVYAYGVGAKPAMEEMEAIIAIKDKFPTCHIQNNEHDPFQINVWNDDRSRVLSLEYLTPKDALLVLNEGKEWFSTEIPDGDNAHKQGYPITANPHDEDTEEYAEWDAAWEASADEADVVEEEEDKQTGSVVSPKYRLKYAEEGHPNHCGDWLAETLNNFVLGDKKTDIETFERICAANNTDTAKYNHTTPGWQGRVRMSGRNAMAPKIWAAKGMHLPPGLIEGTTWIPAPADWLAEQSFKKAKEKIA